MKTAVRVVWERSGSRHFVQPSPSLLSRGLLRGRGTAGGGAREAGRAAGHGVPERTDPYLLMETGCIQEAERPRPRL